MNMLSMVTGAEDLDLDGTGAQEGAEAVAAAVSAEVAELGAQIEEQGTQIEALAEEVKTLDETAEEVLENVEGLEGMMQSGNFSSIGFANIFNRTDKLASKLGGRSNGSRLGAESISDATTAQMMARTGIEGFMDTLKAWGKKAIEYIKHIFNTVIAFVVGLFSAAAGIQKQAENLEHRLAEAKLKDKIKLGGWNAYFDYKANGLSAQGESAAMSAFGEGLTKLVDQMKSASEVNVSAYSSAYTDLVNSVKALAVAGKGSKKKETKQNGKDVLVGQHAGIRMMVSWKDGDLKDEKACAEGARDLRLTIGKDAAEVKKLSTGETPSKATVADLKKVLGDIKASALMLRAIKVTSKFSAAERDRVVGMLNAVSATDEKKKESVAKSIEVVKATFAATIAMYSVATRHQTAESRAGLAMVAAHMGIGGSHDIDDGKKKK